MLKISSLSLSFHHKILFDSANLSLNAKEKIAIVGENGSGKSTLLKLIQGQAKPDSGSILLKKSTRIGYVPQISQHSDLSLHALVLQLTTKHSFEKALSNITNLLPDYSKKLGQYSGGEQVKLMMAIAMSHQPDLLLLDEPTNHLDAQTQTWLGEFIAKFRGAVIVVSHDSKFVNYFASSVCEISQQKITKFAGNYDDYIKQKSALLANQEAAHRAAEKKLNKLKANWFEIAANKGAKITKRRKDNDKMAFDYRAENAGEKQSQRLHQIERRIKETLSEKPELPKSIIISSKASKPERRLLLQLQNCVLTLPDAHKIGIEDISIYTNDKILLKGPNGSGKTSLLNALAASKVNTKYSNIHSLAYLSQHDEQANNSQKALDYFCEVSRLPEYLGRSYFARLLFAQDEVFVPMSKLSAGQRMRLELTLHILSNPDLLLLDEPTNHLDVRSKAVIQKLLTEYEGAFILVSHDSELVKSLTINKQIVLDKAEVLETNAGTNELAEKLFTEVRQLNVDSSRDRYRAKDMRQKYLTDFDSLDSANGNMGGLFDEWLEAIAEHNVLQADYLQRQLHAILKGDKST
ncbi:MAG: ABC-F family ATP-binding cassette domain-containing protein [Candidatus Saccharibacteria bacterium]